jgi:hypothetical protein
MQAKATKEKAAAEDIIKRMTVLKAGKQTMDGSVAQLRNEVAADAPKHQHCYAPFPQSQYGTFAPYAA